MKSRSNRNIWPLVLVKEKRQAKEQLKIQKSSRKVSDLTEKISKFVVKNHKVMLLSIQNVKVLAPLPLVQEFYKNLLRHDLQSVKEIKK